MNDGGDWLKVTFLLERDESGYPPVERELLWCKPGIARTYEIASIPFFVRVKGSEMQIRGWRRRSMRSP